MHLAPFTFLVVCHRLSFSAISCPAYLLITTFTKVPVTSISHPISTVTVSKSQPSPSRPYYSPHVHTHSPPEKFKPYANHYRLAFSTFAWPTLFLTPTITLTHTPRRSSPPCSLNQSSFGLLVHPHFHALTQPAALTSHNVSYCLFLSTQRPIFMLAFYVHSFEHARYFHCHYPYALYCPLISIKAKCFASPHLHPSKHA